MESGTIKIWTMHSIKLHQNFVFVLKNTLTLNFKYIVSDLNIVR